MNILDWLLFARMDGNYAGGHLSSYLLLVISGVILFVQTMRRTGNMGGFKMVIAPYVLMFSVFFVACFHEVVFTPAYVIANSVFWDGLPHFQYIWTNNVYSFRIDQMAFWVASGVGLFLFRRFLKFNSWDWLALSALLVGWVAIGLPVSLPLPDGSGPFLHDSYLSNGLEFAYNLLFSIVIIRATLRSPISQSIRVGWSKFMSLPPLSFILTIEGLSTIPLLLIVISTLKG